MRYREFTINIPINIRLNGDGSVDFDQGDEDDSIEDKDELDPNPVFVPPLQQQIELSKADQGKSNPVIQKLTQDDELGDDEEPEEIGAPQNLKRFK